MTRTTVPKYTQRHLPIDQRCSEEELRKISEGPLAAMEKKLDEELAKPIVLEDGLGPNFEDRFG